MADTQLPLQGITLCCTSIPPEKRSELAAIASQMGAVHKLDLTSDVTHLVVGETDTPKYKFVARERSDVKCILPSWIEAVRASWLQGGSTDIEDLERIHKLPTFAGLRLCVTGFDDLIYRKELEELINNNGGEYRGNLTKDVTHLIAKEPTGAKYDFAGQWAIRTVGVEWLEQSLERGMILDESLYRLTIRPEERGRDAWLRKPTSSTSLGKRPRDDDLVPPNARKLRRTASARLSDQNVGLWSELVGAPVKVEKETADAWDERRPTETMKKKVASLASKFKNMKVAPKADRRPSLFAGLFRDKVFLLHGFDEKKALIIQDHLRSHGAEIIDNPSQWPSLSVAGYPKHRLLLTPYTMLASDAPLDSKSIDGLTIVTDLWVERCIYKKELEDPYAHATSTPFSRLPSTGFANLVICSTGFQGIDLLHTSKAVKLLGASYDEYFTPKSSVLLCNNVVSGQEKLTHAQFWSIPVVKPDWLWDSIRKGELMPYSSYLVQPITNPSRSLQLAKEARKEDTSSKVIQDSGKQTEAKARAYADTNPKKRSKDSSKAPPHPPPNEGSGRRIDLKPKLSCKTSSSVKDESGTSAIHLDDETPLPPASCADNDSSNSLVQPSASVPLREITPNSSPPKRSSPPKPISPAKIKDPPSPKAQNPPSASEDSALGPAISSLLAARQKRSTNSNANSHPPASNSSEQQPYRRRRRQLFGRAPSNLSSHSINLSRASSVDTMNTDGVGTPLEPSNSFRHSSKPEINNSNKNNITNDTTNNNNSTTPTADFPLNLYSTHHNDDDPDRLESQNQHLQMTQLGYEDPDVAAWRERVAIKMSGGKVKPGTPARKSAAAGTSKGESLGIAKRTRLATSK